MGTSGSSLWDEAGHGYPKALERRNGEKRTMSCDGYESSRHCLQKKCPVKFYGINAEASEVVSTKEASPLSIAAARKGMKVKQFFQVNRSGCFSR